MLVRPALHLYAAGGNSYVTVLPSSYRRRLDPRLWSTRPTLDSRYRLLVAACARATRNCGTSHDCFRDLGVVRRPDYFATNGAARDDRCRTIAMPHEPSHDTRAAATAAQCKKARHAAARDHRPSPASVAARASCFHRRQPRIARRTQVAAPPRWNYAGRTEARLQSITYAEHRLLVRAVSAEGVPKFV